MTDPHQGEPPHSRRFDTTRWTVIAAAAGSEPEAHEALVQLCETYWFPVYAYARLRAGDADAAREQTQGFFAAFLDSEAFRRADPQRGRFRSFLLASFNNYVANERRHAKAARRGGGQVKLSLDFERAEGRYTAEPRHEDTPESLFERQWALALVSKALDRLEMTMDGEGTPERFAALSPHLTSDDGLPYSQLAERLGMSESAVKAAMHRLRVRFGKLLREQLAETVHDPDQVNEELRHLLRVLSTG